MFDEPTTRRDALRTAGIAAATAAVPAGVRAGSGWERAESPVDAALHDVVHTAAGAYAVGGGGAILERTDRGWRTVADGGPTGNGNDLYGADVTDDGERVWVAGSSGAIGEYDVVTGTLVDRSAPMDVTNNFNGVAATGPAGDANVYVAGDSGKAYYSFENGAEGTWDSVTPGPGSNCNAVHCYDDRAGHLVDGNKTVFHATDGATWEKTGVEGADYNFYGVDSHGPDDVWVAGGGGSIYHWNGTAWRRADTGDASLRDVEVGDGDGDGDGHGDALAVGGGGGVYERTADGWVRRSTPTGANLRAVAAGAVDVAVGASGTILER